MRALEDRDLLFFRDNGYVVVHDAVPPAQSRAAAEALWAFLDMNPNDPDGWYRYPTRPGVTTVEMYHHQAFWDVRQFPRVYDAFVDILGEERLWVSIDRASFKPPRHRRHPDYDFKGFIHWDGDPAALSTQALVLQGVLCLTDTDERMGGFQCVPGHHRRLEEWLANRPGRAESGRSGRGRRWLRRLLDPSGGARERARPNPLSADALTRAAWFSGYPAADVKRLSNAAGDLIVWDQRLPHGNGRNVSGRPRLAQYVTMFPAREDDAALREARVSMWRERTAPPDAGQTGGDPRAWERSHCEPATLTDLGRRLLGLDAWTPAVP